MNQEKLRQYYSMITDSWKFFKDHSVIENKDDNFWNKALDKSAAIGRQYGDNIFITTLLMLMVEEIDRLDREEREK